MRGGIFLGKMPLGLKLSIKSRIETAVAQGIRAFASGATRIRAINRFEIIYSYVRENR
jgi:hypothetical protein